MKFFVKLFKIMRKIEHPFIVTRISRDGLHHYSIIAWDGGFEFIFRNGFDSWSTISPSFAKRILARNLEGQMGDARAKTASDFLELAALGAGTKESRWTQSDPIRYRSKENAIEIERQELDIAWMKVEE